MFFMNYTYVLESFNAKFYHDKLDRLHRLDGPAIEYADGTEVWYFNGKRIGDNLNLFNQEKFERYIKLTAFV